MCCCGCCCAAAASSGPALVPLRLALKSMWKALSAVVVTRIALDWEVFECRRIGGLVSVEQTAGGAVKTPSAAPAGRQAVTSESLT